MPASDTVFQEINTHACTVDTRHSFFPSPFSVPGKLCTLVTMQTATNITPNRYHLNCAVDTGWCSHYKCKINLCKTNYNLPKPIIMQPAAFPTRPTLASFYTSVLERTPKYLGWLTFFCHATVQISTFMAQWSISLLHIYCLRRTPHQRNPPESSQTDPQNPQQPQRTARLEDSN